MRPLPSSTAAWTARAGSLVTVVTLAVSAAAFVPPALAQQQKQPVKASSVTCVEPGDADFGAAVVELTFRRASLPEDDHLLVVPVDDATGLDAGDRLLVDRTQAVVAVTIAADGAALTPAVTVEVRRGGDVVQRIPVPGGCGVVDPDPDQGPVIGAITRTGDTVTVAVTNVNDGPEEVGVTLWPTGSTTGESRFIALGPGESGSVAFTGVPAGQYVVEAFGYTTLTQTTSAPFEVA